MKLWKIIGIKVAIFTKNIPDDISFFWGHRYLFNGVEHRSRVNFEFLNPHQNSMLNQLYSYELCWLLTKFYIWWFSACMYKKIYKFDDLYAFNISNFKIKKTSITITKTLLIVPTKNERDPPLFTGKLLIKFQNILRNTTQVIIRHRVKMLFSVISSPITLERQKWKSSKKKGILLSSPVNSW